MTEDSIIRSFFDIPIEHFPDRSARWLLQYKENIQGLLEIVASELVHLIDFDRLSLLNRSFVAENLKAKEADILYTVPFRDGSESDELLIYILIEHQSTVDIAMAFRVLSYMMQIWQMQLEEMASDDVKKSQWRLHPILPIVFYSGDRSWNTPLTLNAIMEIPDELSRFVPKFDILFLSVKETDTANLMQVDHPFGWMLSVLQKEKSDKEMIVNAIVESVSRLNAFSPTELEQRLRAIHYLILLILHRRPVNEHDDLLALVDQHAPDMEVEVMIKSMADMLIEEGKAAGIALGKAEGLEQGEIRAKRETIFKLIQRRFGSIPESISDQVGSIDDLSRLDILFDEVWDADSLDEIDFSNDDN